MAWPSERLHHWLILFRQGDVGDSAPSWGIACPAHAGDEPDCWQAAEATGTFPPPCCLLEGPVIAHQGNTSGCGPGPSGRLQSM